MLGGGRGGVDGLGLSAGGTTLWPILVLGLTAQGGGGLEPPKTRFSCTRLDGGGAGGRGSVRPHHQASKLAE